MLSLRLALLSAIALGAMLPGCSDFATGDDVPAYMQAYSGDAQDGIVGEELDFPLAVVVRAARGTPIQDMSVTWTSDDGSVTSSGVTDADGISTARWELGPTPGDQEAHVTVPGLGKFPFSANASEWYVRHDYSGSQSGGFRALEPAEIDESGRFLNTEGFVMGLIKEPSGEDPGWWGVVAFHARTFTVGHMVLFDTEGTPEPGEYDLPGDVYGIADFDVRLVDGAFQNSGATVFHDFASGTFTLTAATDDLLEGTFEGQAHAIDSGTGVVTVTEGRFRVPVFNVQESPVAAAVSRSGAASVEEWVRGLRTD